MKTVSATDMLRIAEARLQNVDSIIQSGNAAFRQIHNSLTQDPTVRWRNGIRYTQQQIVAELASYGVERLKLTRIIEFYETIGID